MVHEIFFKKNIVIGFCLYAVALSCCHVYSDNCLQEHIDYDVVKSANPEFKKATVRINIYKQHRQTIQVSKI